MQVSQLWRYPVKSMLGGTVDEIELDDLGIVEATGGPAVNVNSSNVKGVTRSTEGPSPSIPRMP